jgi:hypothetical protein
MDNLNYILVRISKIRLFLRFFSLVMVFVPAIISFNGINTEGYFWGIWGITWIIAFFVQVTSIPKYLIVGNIILSEKNIEVLQKKYNFKINIAEIKKLYATFDGYKGKPNLNHYIQMLYQMPTNKEGVCELDIKTYSKKLKLNFLIADSITEQKARTFFYALEKRGIETHIINN